MCFGNGNNWIIILIIILILFADDGYGVNGYGRTGGCSCNDGCGC